jgi:hypothetical protein
MASAYPAQTAKSKCEAELTGSRNPMLRPPRAYISGKIELSYRSQKKAGVMEHPEVSDNAGLLFIGPPNNNWGAL